MKISNVIIRGEADGRGRLLIQGYGIRCAKPATIDSLKEWGNISGFIRRARQGYLSLWSSEL